MFANRYTALIDACSLVSVWRRNLLLSLAEAEFFRVRWSSQILAETERTLARLQADRGFPDATARAARAIASMKRAFPEALVEDFDRLLGSAVGLPDPGDEHVVAAALKTQAQAIVTENLSDFPANVLGSLNLEARSADEFIADTIALEEGLAISAIRAMRQRLQRPEMQPGDMLRSLEAHGLLETASILAPHIGVL
jgi:predicted nucleic acid-binding protein